jgi:hypothetical protein
VAENSLLENWKLKLVSFAHLVLRSTMSDVSPGRFCISFTNHLLKVPTDDQ